MVQKKAIAKSAVSKTRTGVSIIAVKYEGMPNSTGHSL
jgi:hypothetical protein